MLETIDASTAMIVHDHGRLLIVQDGAGIQIDADLDAFALRVAKTVHAVTGSWPSFSEVGL